MSTHHISEFWRAWRDSHTLKGYLAPKSMTCMDCTNAAKAGAESSASYKQPNSIELLDLASLFGPQPIHFPNIIKVIYRLVVTPTGTSPDNQSNLTLIYSGALLSNTILALPL